MKIKTTDLFIIIEAEEDMLLVGSDGYGAKLIYLGKNDSPDNYTEILAKDYVEPTLEDEMIRRLANKEEE